jgi:hypothetical protein
MSRKDAVTIATRSLAFLMIVWVLAELSYLPERIQSYVRYSSPNVTSDYWRHYYLISTGFLIARILGISLLARWLYRGGPDVEELFLPQPDLLESNGQS